MVTGKIRKLLCYSLAIGGIILTFSFWGCSKNTNDVDTTTADNSAFGTMSDTEKQQYVHDYLLEKYGLDCDVPELSFRQVDVFHNEKHLHTTAFTDDGFGFSVWVHPRTGEIYDTAFTYYLQDDVNQYIEGLLSEAGYECQINDAFYINKIEFEEFDQSSIPQMLKAEYTDNRIRMKIKSSDIDEEMISSALAGIKGCIFIYIVDSFDEEVVHASDYSINLK